MQTKVQAYVQLADETSLKITGNYLDWLSFLTTASRLYKYPYHDQLMIYAQRPDASACAAYELWNGTMHRYIRRGAKGIALLKISNSTESLLEEQRQKLNAEYYAELEHQYDLRDIIIHDIKGHLRTIKQLSQNGENDRINSYIARPVWTENT